jgi:hypothetical protein
MMRRLEADYPTLEETGCKVGIGVATGADQVFIGPSTSSMSSLIANYRSS